MLIISLGFGIMHYFLPGLKNKVRKKIKEAMMTIVGPVAVPL